MKVTKNEKETKIVEVSYTITLTEVEAKRLAFVCDIVDWSESGETGKMLEALYVKLPYPDVKLEIADGVAASVRITEKGGE